MKKKDIEKEKKKIMEDIEIKRLNDNIIIRIQQTPSSTESMYIFFEKHEKMLNEIQEPKSVKVFFDLYNLTFDPTTLVYVKPILDHFIRLQKVSNEKLKVCSVYVASSVAAGVIQPLIDRNPGEVPTFISSNKDECKKFLRSSTYEKKKLLKKKMTTESPVQWKIFNTIRTKKSNESLLFYISREHDDSIYLYLANRQENKLQEPYVDIRLSTLSDLETKQPVAELLKTNFLGITVEYLIEN